MNTPITAHSKALADEGRCAAEELVKAKHEIIAELARVTKENTRLRVDAKRLESKLEMAIGVWENSERDKPLGKSKLAYPPIWIVEARAALAAHREA